MFQSFFETSCVITYAFCNSIIEILLSYQLNFFLLPLPLRRHSFIISNELFIFSGWNKVYDVNTWMWLLQFVTCLAGMFFIFIHIFSYILHKKKLPEFWSNCYNYFRDFYQNILVASKDYCGYLKVPWWAVTKVWSKIGHYFNNLYKQHKL